MNSLRRSIRLAVRCLAGNCLTEMKTFDTNARRGRWQTGVGTEAVAGAASSERPPGVHIAECCARRERQRSARSGLCKVAVAILTEERDRP